MPLILDGDLEQTSHEGAPRPHVVTIDIVTLPLPDHRRPITSQCPSGRSQAAEAEPWTNQPFNPAVILLDDVTQILALALSQPREAPQLYGVRTCGANPTSSGTAPVANSVIMMELQPQYGRTSRSRHQ